MLPEDADIYVINASQYVGNHSGAVGKPDLVHIRGELDRVGPDLVLGCGKVAQRALDQLDAVHIKVPHPAWRQLKRERVLEIRDMLAELLEEL
jgi:hypothetical protein